MAESPVQRQAGITPAEHQRIIATERTPERGLFYELLWESAAQATLPLDRGKH